MQFEAEMWPRVRVLLAGHLGMEADHIQLEQGSSSHAPDALVYVDDMNFVLAIKMKATSESILNGVYQLKHYLINIDETVIPLLIVPYMGDAGSGLCKREGISWMDLSGNANIRSKGLIVNVSGRPNHFQRRGRPQSLFAAQNSRLARWLLLNPDSTYTHSDLVEHTRLDPGYATRILHRMMAEGYVKRSADRRYRLVDGPRLLQDWYISQSFNKHKVVAGSCFSTSGSMLVRELALQLSGSATRYAFTGLAAAWLYTKHVSFILTTLYVDAPIDQPLMDHLGFHADARGANTWLVQPSDDGVFDGTRLVDGAQCVHPVQVYIDLKDQPERAAEASSEILTLSEFSLLVET
jgi:hypothetical protein